MESKPKFDKKKCLKCKYHGKGLNLGWPVKVKSGEKYRTVYVYCDFVSHMSTTPLRAVSKTETIDLRGEDYNNCKLFVEGDPVEHKKQITLRGSIK
ncbi:MAG: hypothetical protein IKF42_06295 [Mogibacterium sp.]|nr:hypothetical protein [Mogibacterium sp.]